MTTEVQEKPTLVLDGENHVLKTSLTKLSIW